MNKIENRTNRMMDNNHFGGKIQESDKLFDKKMAQMLAGIKFNAYLCNAIQK